MCEQSRPRTQEAEEMFEGLTEIFIVWLKRLVLAMMIFASLAVGYFLGNQRLEIDGTMSMLVVAWFHLSTFSVLFVFFCWLAISVYDFMLDLIHYYKNYQDQVVFGAEKTEIDLFYRFKEIFGDDLVPRFAWWIYVIYGWPLMFVCVVVGIVMVVVGVVVGRWFVILDHWIKNLIIKKFLAHSLSSLDPKIRKRGEKIVASKKQSSRAKKE